MEHGFFGIPCGVRSFANDRTGVQAVFPPKAAGPAGRQGPPRVAEAEDRPYVSPREKIEEVARLNPGAFGRRPPLAARRAGPLMHPFTSSFFRRER